MISKIDVFSIVKSRLTSWFEDAVNLKTVLEAIADQVQGIDDAIVDLIADRYLATAAGAQLDQWGVMLGEPRFGRPDDEYRRAILVRVLRNTTTATPDRMTRIARAMTGAELVRYSEIGGATFMLDFFGSTATPEVITRMKAAITEAKPAGVQFFAGSSPNAVVFGTDGPMGRTGGLASLSQPDAGAPLASLI